MRYLIISMGLNSYRNDMYPVSMLSFNNQPARLYEPAELLLKLTNKFKIDCLIGGIINRFFTLCTN
jgi:hypothetical protein